MKNTQIRKGIVLFVVLFFLSLGAFAQSVFLNKLQEMPDVSATKVLESTQFKEKYVTYFTQPLDHKEPSKGNFKQRVIVAHVGFDRPTVIVTEGYGAAYALNPKYREELSKLLDANMIFVEHRYFLESTPQPKDWQYLTAENSAEDLHAITMAFKKLYTGKWISTGISKGGQTSMLYRAFFPNDVDISVPYVAPLCFDREDGRHEPFLKKVSTAEDRKKIEDFQLEVLKRKSTLLPIFERYCADKKYKFSLPIEEVYDYCVLEYSFAMWQWGTSIKIIPETTAPDDMILAHLLAISEPSYFVKDGDNTSFFVQAACQLGYYGYDIRPFKKYLSIKSSKDYLRKMMIPVELENVKFDKTFSKRVKTFLKMNDPKMVFIYGEYDPWTAAGVTWLKGKKNIHLFVQTKGSHATRIGTLPEPMKQEAISLIKGWLEEK